MLLLLLSTALVAGIQGCQGCTTWDSCGGEGQYCFQGSCLTTQEFMVIRFKLGSPCTVNEDCPEVCRTSLSPPTCGPLLGRRRTPAIPKAPECDADAQCQGEEQCFPRGGTRECLTTATFMHLQFALGSPCTSRAGCPEDCWASTGTCGPYLRRRMGDVSPENGSDMDKIPQKGARRAGHRAPGHRAPGHRAPGHRALGLADTPEETGTDFDGMTPRPGK